MAGTTRFERPIRSSPARTLIFTFSALVFAASAVTIASSWLVGSNNNNHGSDSDSSSNKNNTTTTTDGGEDFTNSILIDQKLIPGEEEFYDTDEERERELERKRLEELKLKEEQDLKLAAATAAQKGDHDSNHTQGANDNDIPYADEKNIITDNSSKNPRVWTTDKLKSWLHHVS